MRIPLVLLLLGSSILHAQTAPKAQEGPPTSAADASATTILALRHAEVAADGTTDPPLSEEGRVRAETLARMLRDAGVTHLWSTDLQRTRQTLAPLVEQTGLEVSFYGPRDLAGLAGRLAKMPGVHVVAGHSNTTPMLVRALGGEPGPPIAEDEHDRLYVVTVMGETVHTTRVRIPPFGEP